MSNDVITLTPNGYQELKNEYKKLTTQDLPQVVKEMDEARSLGDLRENEAYQSARHRQAMLKGRIEELEHILKNAEVIEKEEVGQVVVWGAKVGVKAEDGTEREFEIVGQHESDVRNNKISSSSPLGQALMHKKVGDTVSVDLPTGTVQYQILFIK